jgi:hypothetical protein
MSIYGIEQLYFIRYLDSGRLHGGVQGNTVPRLYQKNTAVREAKKINLATADSDHLRTTYGFVEVIPVYITMGAPIQGNHLIA